MDDELQRYLRQMLRNQHAIMRHLAERSYKSGKVLREAFHVTASMLKEMSDDQATDTQAHS